MVSAQKQRPAGLTEASDAKICRSGIRLTVGTSIYPSQIPRLWSSILKESSSLQRFNSICCRISSLPRRAERFLRNQRISNHNDWQLGRNSDSYNDPLPSISQNEHDYFSALFGGGAIGLLCYPGVPRSAYRDDIDDVVDNEVAASPPKFVSEQSPVSIPVNAKFNAASEVPYPDFVRQSSSNGSPNITSSGSASSHPSSTPASTMASSSYDKKSPGAKDVPFQYQLHDPPVPRIDPRPQPMFPCPLCPNRRPFKSQSSLKRHTRTHTRPYECRVADGCDVRCAEQRDRVRHEATHGIQPEGAPRYYCPHEDCDWHVLGSEGGFGVRLDNAKRHVTRLHAGSTAGPIRIEK